MTAWFGATPPAGFKIGTYTGGGIGLSTGGDAVNLFDAPGNHMTGVSFGVSTTGKTFDNTAGSAARRAAAASRTLSTAGATAPSHAWWHRDGFAGTKATTVVVSEVAPWGSGDATYAADWFELTNSAPKST